MRGILGPRTVKAGGIVVAGLLLCGLASVPLSADVICATYQSGTVRIYNPQDFQQDGTLRVTPIGQAPGTNDTTQTYSLPAHNVGIYAVTGGVIRVIPGTGSQNNQEPDPVVDVEVFPDGGIASPALFSSFSNNPLSGSGNGTLFVIAGDQGATAVVCAYNQGKPSSAVTKVIPAGGAISLTAGGEYSVDFISGDGVAAFDAGEQRELPETASLLGTAVVMSWAKPSSKTLKPSVTEWYGMIHDDNATLAAFVAQDPQFLAKFGDVATVGAVLTNWAAGNPAWGGFTSVPVKVVKGTVYLFVSGTTEVSGLTAKKLSNGSYQITVNAPNGYSAMLGLLAGEVGRNLTRYYSTVDPSTKPNATWANSKMNKAFPSAAPPLIAEGGLIVPYVTHDAAITVMNPSPWTTTLTVSYALMGNDPRTGTATTVTLQPGQTSNVQNLLPNDQYLQEGSAYVATNGPRPSVAVTRPGLDIPVLPEEAANNMNPLTNILQTGGEDEIILTGPSTANHTVNHSAYGPDGSGPANAQPEYGPPNLVSIGRVSDIYQLGLPPNSSSTMIPLPQTASKVCTLLLYTDPTTSDQRIRAGQSFTLAGGALAYVLKWLPPTNSRFYLKSLVSQRYSNRFNWLQEIGSGSL